MKLNGKSLLERDIEVCLNSGFIDKVIVTCDNPEAKKVSESFSSDKVQFFLRDSFSTIRSISLVATLKEIINKYDKEYRGVSVLSYIQTPFVKTQILNEAISSLLINNADSSCGVELMNKQFYKKSKYGLIPLNQGNKAVNSDFDKIYKDSQTFTALKNKNLIMGSLKGALVSCFEVSREESFFINSEEDLKIAEILINDEKN